MWEQRHNDVRDIIFQAMTEARVEAPLLDSGTLEPSRSRLVFAPADWAGGLGGSHVDTNKKGKFVCGVMLTCKVSNSFGHHIPCGKHLPDRHIRQELMFLFPLARRRKCVLRLDYDMKTGGFTSMLNDVFQQAPPNIPTHS